MARRGDPVWSPSAWSKGRRSSLARLFPFDVQVVAARVLERGDAQPRARAVRVADRDALRAQRGARRVEVLDREPDGAEGLRLRARGAAAVDAERGRARLELGPAAGGRVGEREAERVAVEADGRAELV